MLLPLHRPSWDRSVGGRDGRGRWGRCPPKPAPPQPRGSLRPQSRSQPQAWEDKCPRNKPRRRQLSAGGTSLPGVLRDSQPCEHSQARPSRSEGPGWWENQTNSRLFPPHAGGHPDCGWRPGVRGPVGAPVARARLPKRRGRPLV